ncbi:MAG: hypothetical protein AB8G99_27015, partial [Planctomycetaceae bacterium]
MDQRASPDILTSRSSRKQEHYQAWFRYPIRETPLKVVYINRRYYPEGVAGPAFSVQSLAEEVSVMGHDASVICLGSSECDIAEHNGVGIHRLSQTAEPDETIATVQQILS